MGCHFSGLVGWFRQISKVSFLKIKMNIIKSNCKAQKSAQKRSKKSALCLQKVINYLETTRGTSLELHLGSILSLFRCIHYSPSFLHIARQGKNAPGSHSYYSSFSVRPLFPIPHQTDKAKKGEEFFHKFKRIRGTTPHSLSYIISMSFRLESGFYRKKKRK